MKRSKRTSNEYVLSDRRNPTRFLEAGYVEVTRRGTIMIDLWATEPDDQFQNIIPIRVSLTDLERFVAKVRECGEEMLSSGED